MQKIDWGRAFTVSMGTTVGGITAFAIAINIEALLDASMPGWYFSDFLVYVVLPMFWFVTALAGAVLLGSVVDYFYLRISRAETTRAEVKNDKVLIISGALGAVFGGLIGHLSAFWVFGLFLNSLVSSFMFVGGFVGALFLVIISMGASRAFKTILILFGIYVISTFLLYIVMIFSHGTGLWQWIPFSPLPFVLLICSPIVTFFVYRFIVVRRRKKVKMA
jgi:hypothetical protein